MDIQTLLELDLVLFLDFADDADQIKEGIFDLNGTRTNLTVEVLVENFLHERIAGWVELLKKFLD